MPKPEFTEEELRALAWVVHTYARSHGEDIVGALLYSGAFKQLITLEGGAPYSVQRHDSALVDLAHKVESLLKE